MKKINLLSAFFLFFLFGCNSNDSVVVMTPPDDTEVEMTPPENSHEVGGPDFVIPGFYIEYYDKENKGRILMDREEIIAFTNDKMTVEFISAIDEITGWSFMEPHEILVEKAFSVGMEFFELWDPKVIRHYSVKFKVPFFKGESVEEIKFIYHHSYDEYRGVKEAWYNGKEIPLKQKEPYIPPEEVYDSEDQIRVTMETYYSGDLVGVISESRTNVHIVVPIE